MDANQVSGAGCALSFLREALGLVKDVRVVPIDEHPIHALPPPCPSRPGASVPRAPASTTRTAGPRAELRPRPAAYSSVSTSGRSDAQG